MKLYIIFLFVIIFMGALLNAGQPNQLVQMNAQRAHEAENRMSRRIRDFQDGFAELSRERYLLNGVILNAVPLSDQLTSVTFLEFSGAFIAASALLGVGNMAWGAYQDHQQAAAARRLRAITQHRTMQRQSRL